MALLEGYFSGSNSFKARRAASISVFYQNSCRHLPCLPRRPRGLPLPTTLKRSPVCQETIAKERMPR